MIHLAQTRKSMNLIATVLLTMFSLPSIASAVVVRYDVALAFEDGSTATGFFDWDTALPDLTDTFDGASENYEISFTRGVFPARTFTDEMDGPFRRGGGFFGTPPRTGLSFGDLFAPDRRNVTIMILDSFDLGADLSIPVRAVPGESGQTGRAGALMRFQSVALTEGSLTGTVLSGDIPEPTTATLAMVGLAGLMRRRRATLAI